MGILLGGVAKKANTHAVQVQLDQISALSNLSSPSLIIN